MIDAERAVLASMCGGRAYVPWATADEMVAQGCVVVRTVWCAVIVWVG